MFVLMIAISVSLDSFLTGIVFGFRRVKISLASYLTMVFLFLLYCILGHFFAITLLSLAQIHPVLVTILQFLGKIALLAIGLYFLIEEHKEKKSSNQTISLLNDPCTADTDKSGSLDIIESFFLTLALSIDTVIALISLVITGTTGILSSISFGIIQSLFLLIGLTLGKFLSNTTLSHKLDFIKSSPGYLLIVAGILRFFLN